ncbi:MAG: PAS domain S-box protein [Gemmataceae bacterium]|nr:PAS domain S-box protein [Gemmata sp.]MDW8197435.1 PAS domain S-box protein [Gemmataceae bacterium]
MVRLSPALLRFLGSRRPTPTCVVVVYSLLFLAWIGLSYLSWLTVVGESSWAFYLDMLKGCVFLAVSAGLLYCAVRCKIRSECRAFNLLQAILDQAADAIFVKDRAGKYLLLNAAAARLVGKPVDEVLGHDDTAIFDAESAARIQANDQRLWQTGQAQTDEEILTDGVTRTYLVTKSPYRDGQGHIIGLIGIARDITEHKQAERECQTRQKRYEQLVATVDGIVWEADAQTFQFTFVSQQAERLLGYPVEQWLHEPDFWVNHLHPEDRQAAIEFCTAATQACQNHDFEYRMVAQDGRVVWLRDIVTLVVENGKPVTLRGIMVDVTQHKKAEEALRLSEARYRDLIEMSPEGIGILHDGKFAYLNRSAAQLLGLEPHQLLGRSLGEFLHPDDREVSQQRQQIVLREHRPVPLRQFRLRHADGSWRIVESCAGPCRFEGQPAVQLIARDVTERIRSEQALREREEQLRIFVEHSWAPIAMLDRQMRYIHISRRWLTDYKLGERNIIGLCHYDVFPEIPERWKEIHRRCLAGAVERCDEDRFERADGSVQYLRWEIQPWRGADGEVKGIVIFTEDITARKRLETQLQHSQKMEAVGRLAGGIAHDFNNLLTVINGYSDLVLRDMAPTDPHREAIVQIHNAGARAARLTQQLLAYSRKAIVEPKVLNLNELIGDSVRLLGRLIGEDIVVTTTLAPTLDPVKVDRGQIEQVLLNLMVNARDAMPTGGRITIETRNVVFTADNLPDDPDVRPGRYVQLTVADTGIGMTEEVKAKIFEPFFTTKGPGKGTGLGLAVVHGAVKLNGGHISVTSTLGVGTTFTIWFPAAEHLPPPSSLIHKKSRGNETILLVEDEDAVRTIAQIGLENQGYKVVTAHDAHDALHKLEELRQPIDLLITDVVMPELGGRELAETLRAQRPNLRVLYISGYNDDMVLRHGLAEAVANFLQKPFTPASLAQKVREILDNPA